MGKRNNGSSKQDNLKITLIALIAVVVLVFVYFYYFIPEKVYEFSPGAEVNQRTFTRILEEANEVNIFMDIRGVDNENTRQNILQCGVDFAGSTGLGGKTVHYFSVDDEGCVAEDGRHEGYDYCFDALTSGVTLYVSEGNETTFHTDSMLVGIDDKYFVGMCGIDTV